MNDEEQGRLPTQPRQKLQGRPRAHFLPDFRRRFHAPCPVRAGIGIETLIKCSISPSRLLRDGFRLYPERRPASIKAIFSKRA